MNNSLLLSHRISFFIPFTFFLFPFASPSSSLQYLWEHATWQQKFSFPHSPHSYLLLSGSPKRFPRFVPPQWLVVQLLCTRHNRKICFENSVKKIRQNEGSLVLCSLNVNKVSRFFFFFLNFKMIYEVKGSQE